LMIWLFIVLSGPVAVLRLTPINIAFQSPEMLTYSFQRITGLIAYSLLFIQIVLGSKMGYWVQMLGARAYGLHVRQGLIAYAFILLHPLLNSAFIYLVSANISDAIASFLPSVADRREQFLNIGRLSFVLLTLSIAVARLRTKPFFRRNWHYYHYLNYVVFFMIFIHARGVGSDVATFPFSIVFFGAPLVVGGLLIVKGYKGVATKYLLENKNYGTKSVK
jgi:predicted ferric reductase